MTRRLAMLPLFLALTACGEGGDSTAAQPAERAISVTVTGRSFGL